VLPGINASAGSFRVWFLRFSLPLSLSSSFFSSAKTASLLPLASFVLRQAFFLPLS
jgi:hypothetical protein